MLLYRLHKNKLESNAWLNLGFYDVWVVRDDV
jgi:hypothetical protein